MKRKILSRKGFIKSNENTEREEGISHILKLVYFTIVTFALIKRMFSGKTGTRKESDL